jgi:hypothetical protein
VPRHFGTCEISKALPGSRRFVGALRFEHLLPATG